MKTMLMYVLYTVQPQLSKPIICTLSKLQSKEKVHNKMGHKIDTHMHKECAMLIGTALNSVQGDVQIISEPFLSQKWDNYSMNLYYTLKNIAVGMANSTMNNHQKPLSELFAYPNFWGWP